MKSISRGCWGLIVLLTAACSYAKPRIDGVFVTTLTGNYSSIWDTIAIKRVEGNDHTYLVINRTGFFLNDDPGVKRFEGDTSVASFDQEHGVLKELRWGRVYVLASSGRTLLFGNAAYQKLNPQME